MDYKVIDILRSPTVIVLDALLARRVNLSFLVGSNHLLSVLITAIGSFLSLVLFTCQKSWLLEIYRFIIGLSMLGGSTYLQTYHLGWCHNQYSSSHPGFNNSVISFVLKGVPLDDVQTMISKKLIYSLLLQLFMYRLFCMECLYGYKKNWTISIAEYAVSTLSIVAILLNVDKTYFAVSAYVTLLPQFLALYTHLGKSFNIVKRHTTNALARLRDGIRANGLPMYIETLWNTLRVPQVLRLFFVFRFTTIILAILWAYPIENDNLEDMPPLGIYHYFAPSSSHLKFHMNARPSFISLPKSTVMEDIFLVTHNKTCPVGKLGPLSSTVKNQFMFFERVAIKLTDSLISIFSVSSAVSVPLYYCGVHLHNFIGGTDIGQAESLGIVSAILFCLLAIQTGLSGLSPPRRLVRLYRNLCLLFAAVLHFVHDLVNPVLITISAQANIPLKTHVKPLLVLVILFVIPTTLCTWLVRTMPISTWLVALVAFCIELIVKVLATFLVYTLFTLDARIDHRPWRHMDDWVFYIQSTAHTIEFICGCVMFVNGAYVLFFESGSILRAFMMSMHAYVNIYKAACDGWKTFNNRWTVNTRISTLLLASEEQLEENRDDVCSICYQTFTTEFGEVRLTSCKHFFHSSCLRKWLYIQDSCPMCHQNIFNIDG